METETQTPSESVRYRLEKPGDAWNILKAAEEGIKPRRAVMQVIQNKFDRISGTSSGGQGGNIRDIDWGGMKAEISTEVEMKFDLATSGETYISCCSDFEEDSPKNPEWMAIFAREDRKMCVRAREDDGWDIDEQITTASFHSVAFGIGAFLRRSPRTWFFDAVHPANILTVPGAGLNPDEWPFYGISTSYSVHQLLEFIEDADAAAEFGWNVEAVGKLIKTRAGKRSGRDITSISEDDFREYDRSNDLVWEFKEPDKIKFYHCYVREFDGTITRHILARDETTGVESSDYIFTKREEFEMMSDSIVLLPHKIVHEQLAKVRGYGVESLAFHDSEDTFLNLMIARILMSSGLVIQAENEDAIDVIENIVWSDLFTLLPPEFKGKQIGLQSNLGDLMGLKDSLSSILRDRHKAFGGPVKVPDRSQTLGESQLNFQEQNKLESIARSQYRKAIGKFHGKRVKAALSPGLPKEAPGTKCRDRMLLRLAQRGVPLSALYGAKIGPYETEKDHKERLKQLGIEKIDDDMILVEGIYGIEAENAFGAGNAADAQVKLGNMGRIFAKMGQQAQNRYLRMFTAATMGDQKFADLFFPRNTNDPDLEQASRTATIENAVLTSGAEDAVPVVSTDRHLIHAAVHTARAQELIEAVGAGQADPRKAVAGLMALNSHVNGEDNQGGHMRWLAQDADNEQQVTSLNQQWNAIQNAIRQLTQQIQAAAEAQQAAQEQDMQNAQLTVPDQLRMEKHALEIELMQAKNKAEIEAIQAKAQADINAKTAAQFPTS